MEGVDPSRTRGFHHLKMIVVGQAENGLLHHREGASHGGDQDPAGEVGVGGEGGAADGGGVGDRTACEKDWGVITSARSKEMLDRPSFVLCAPDPGLLESRANVEA